jgi:geranylgeranyl diphosphate synthase type II
MKWEDELSRIAEMINHALEDYLPHPSVYPTKIHEAMRYSLFAGGKRLRGAFTIAAAVIFGVEEKRVLPAAGALEMIHTYSLIHDDLPAMDDDDYRRGKPTCHKVFGEAIAILAGDALLTRAFEILCLLREEGFAESTVLQVVQEVAKAAGSLGMIGGQVVDLESEGVAVSREILEYIHRHKTGALFLAAVRSGALLGAAPEDELQALTEYARAFGLSYQIIDDLLDITGDEKLLGKKTGRDLAKKKATYPALLGTEQARELAAEQVKICHQSLAPFGPQGDFLRDAALYLLSRKS